MKKVILLVVAVWAWNGCAGAGYDTGRYHVPCQIPATRTRVNTNRNTDSYCSSTAHADAGVDAFQEGSYAAGCFHAEKEKAEVTVSLTDFWAHWKHEMIHLLDVYCLKPGAKPTEPTEGAGEFSPKQGEEETQERSEVEGIRRWTREAIENAPKQ
jgi:hypothetical protein